MQKVDLNQTHPGYVPFPVPEGEEHGHWCRRMCAMHLIGNTFSCKLAEDEHDANAIDCVRTRRADKLRVVYVAVPNNGVAPWPPGFVPPEEP